MADYALKKEKKKSKAPCVVCMVLYLIVALAVCTSYAARGGTAGSLKYKVLIKAARGLLHGEFFYGLKSLQNIKTGIIMLAQTWYVHVIVVGAMLVAFMGKVEYAFKGVEQGSAHWASDDEKKKFADPEGVPVAKGIYVSLKAGKKIDKVKQAAVANTNKVVIATTGAGKTEGVIKPDVMQMLGNYFIIDPKGSVYQDCAYLLKKYGYNVRVLNFYNVELSYHYNPYAYINSELDVLNLGADFMNATKEDGEKNDYWTGAAEDFFTSLILYIYKSKDETNKSFERVVQILTSIDYQDRKLSPVCEYSLLMEKYAIDRENEGLDEDKVVLNYKGMKGLPQETLGGVVANLQKRLGLWYTEVVSKFTAEDEMEFDNFTKPNSKEAIFVIYPIGSTTFKPIISMFYQQFISRMKYMASQKCGGSLPVMLNIEADEICNISKIPTLKDDIATIRSMNIRMTFVIQSLTQLQAKYDKEAEDILSNCGIVCFFGSRDNKIRNKNSKNGYRTIFVNDEVQTMLTDYTGQEATRSSKYYEETYRRIRKLGGIPTAIVQNISTFSKSTVGNAMMDNASMTILCQQGEADIEVAAARFKLTPEETKWVSSGVLGTGIIKVGQKKVMYDMRIPRKVRANSLVYELCATDPSK